MVFTPISLRRLLNIYPPYVGAGIKIKHVSPDWKELRVEMPLRWYNRNSVKTHFGGSLYSMIDPHLMLMLMQILGRRYLIWDKAADIEFLKASKRTVTSLIIISDKDIADIKLNTEQGEKYLPTFTVEIRDDVGELVARVRKTLYIKKK